MSTKRGFYIASVPILCDRCAETVSAEAAEVGAHIEPSVFYACPGPCQRCGETMTRRWWMYAPTTDRNGHES